jgi:hypothetical protein
MSFFKYDICESVELSHDMVRSVIAKITNPINVNYSS